MRDTKDGWIRRPCRPGWLLLTLSLLAGCTGLRRMGPVRADVMQARQLSEQGLDAWQQGQRSEAEQMFAQAVARCPNDAAARCHLADCLWQRGDADQAIEQLGWAVELMEYPDVALIVQLGQMQLESGSLSAATELAERATRLDPQHAAAWRLKGLVQERQGQPNDALDSYYRSLSYDAYQSETLLAVAEVYQQLGRPSRTLATLNQLGRQSSGVDLPQRVWILRALAQQELHRPDEALESLRHACQQGPPTADLLGQLVQLQWQLGQQEAARQTLRDAFVLASPQEQASLRQLMTQLAMLPSEPTNRALR